MNSAAGVSLSRRPNSPACLIALIMSDPVLASASTLAPELCAASSGPAKSVVPSASRLDPATLPPSATSALLASASSDWPSA